MCRATCSQRLSTCRAAQFSSFDFPSVRACAKASGSVLVTSDTTSSTRSLSRSQERAWAHHCAGPILWGAVARRHPGRASCRNASPRWRKHRRQAPAILARPHALCRCTRQGPWGHYTLPSSAESLSASSMHAPRYTLALASHRGMVSDDTARAGLTRPAPGETSTRRSPSRNPRGTARPCPANCWPSFRRSGLRPR